MTEARLLGQEIYELSPEMEQALNVKQRKKNIGIMRSFFMREQIKSPSDIDCYVRDRFVAFLDMQDISARTRENYIRDFDNLVITNVPIFGTMAVFSPDQSFFRQDRMFLLYLPDKEKAKSFKQVVDKTDLIIDISGIRFVKVKEQLKQILCGILNMEYSQRYRRSYLKPFKCFIEFVRKQGLEDILQLEVSDEKRFALFLNSENDWIRQNCGKFITFCRRELFLSSSSIEWNANVWFLERFRLDKSRVNESCPVERLSFLDIANKYNRNILQEYMKYLIGITDVAVSTCRNRLSSLSKFLQFLDGYGVVLGELDEEIIIDYVEYLTGSGAKIRTGNRDIAILESFFQYARMKCHIDIRFHSLKRYMRKDFLQHNDRCVPAETVSAILNSIHEFQKPLGLMYLILFCTGIRKSEICLLKGGAFYKANGEYWMRVYQQKAGFAKVIPIPEELYQEAETYARENGIEKGEYMFKNADGNAYNSVTFSSRMIEECSARGISCGDYIFRAHDYRHNMATMLRDKGVSLQATREYMGHQSEDMTKQYLDHMQERILSKQEEYLSRNGGIEDV